MNHKRLFIGTGLLSLAYALSSTKAIEDTYVWQLPLEALLYSAVVLFALAIKPIKTWLKVSLLAALTNTVLAFIWPVVLAIPLGISLLFSVPQVISNVMSIAFFSAVGGATFYFVLRSSLGSAAIPKKTLKYIILLVPLAGIAALLPDPQYFIPAHKALWWFLFSVALTFALSQENPMVMLDLARLANSEVERDGSKERL